MLLPRPFARPGPKAQHTSGSGEGEALASGALEAGALEATGTGSAALISSVLLVSLICAYAHTGVASVSSDAIDHAARFVKDREGIGVPSFAHHVASANLSAMSEAGEVIAAASVSRRANPMAIRCIDAGKRVLFFARAHDFSHPFTLAKRVSVWQTTRHDHP